MSVVARRRRVLSWLLLLSLGFVAVVACSGNDAPSADRSTTSASAPAAPPVVDTAGPPRGTAVLPPPGLQVLWSIDSKDLDKQGDIGPPVTADGVVAISTSGNVLTFDMKSGRAGWTRATRLGGGQVEISPVGDGFLFCDGDTVHLVAARTGEDLWTQAASDPDGAGCAAFASAVADGRFAVYGGGQVWVGDAHTGKKVWSTTTGGYQLTVGDGVVVGTNQRKIKVFDERTGEARWEATMSGEVSFPFADSGSVYVQMDDTITAVGDGGVVRWSVKSPAGRSHRILKVVDHSVVWIDDDGQFGVLSDVDGGEVALTSVPASTIRAASGALVFGAGSHLAVLDVRARTFGTYDIHVETPLPAVTEVGAVFVQAVSEPDSGRYRHILTVAQV